jgi:hypothetical protein
MSVSTESQRLNGVDVPTLFATLDAVKAQNDIAKFRFRASNEWLNGTHSRSTYDGFFGAGQEMAHRQPTVVESTTRRSSSAPTMLRRRSSTCCTRSPPA